jgi:TrpR family trp operon transcriptional repressor
MRKEMKSSHREDLLEVLVYASKDKKVLDLFLRDILTLGEYREIAERWQIVKKLEEGITQRDISRELGVAVSTITRGSRILANPNGGVNQVIEKLLPRK